MRRRPGSWPALLLAAVTAAGLTTAVREAPPAAADVRPSRAPVTADERVALDAARRTGDRIEVTRLRTETRQVFAEPRGTLTMETAALPVRVRRPGGGWRPLDTTMRERPDGSVGPAAVPHDLTLSGGGSGPLAVLTNAGRSVSLGWPGRLPRPALRGATAVYPEVLRGVDLEVQAHADGFTHLLVVKDRRAAESPRLQRLRYALEGDGLTTRQQPDGTLAAVDAAGRPVVRTGRALMWDASPGGRDRPAVAGMRLTGRELEITPDRRLLTGPGTRYPVRIDPSFSTGNWPWAYANTANGNNTTDVARVGKSPDQGWTYRSFFTFPLGPLAGKHVLSAVLSTRMVHSWSCGSTPVSVWHTAPIASSPRTAWSPGLWQWLASASGHAHKGSADCGNQPDARLEFRGNLPGVVQATAGGSLTLGLSTLTSAGTGESTVSWWKKFAPADTILSVEYNTPPAQPVTQPGNPALPCVTGDARPSVNTATPQLSARTNDADAGQFLTATFTLTRIGQGVVGTIPVPTVPPGTVATASVPAGMLTEGGSYSWTVRTSDGIDGSAASPPCEFTVDATAPNAEPTVDSTVYPADPDGFHGGVGVSAPFTFGANGVPDVAGFDWSWQTLPVSATGAPMVAAPGGSVTLTLTPPPPVPTDPGAGGQLVLRVRSVDRGGLRGPVRSYAFLVGSAPGPAGRWGFEETAWPAEDGSGHGHAASPTGTVGWAPGKVGERAAAPNGGWLGTAGPVLNTDGPFSVAAWLKVRQLPTGSVTAVAQDGTFTSGFFFGLSVENGVVRPALRMPVNDAGSGAWGVVASPTALTAADVGRWLHLAAVFDPAGSRMTLYVDGVQVATATRPAAALWRAAGPLTLGRALWSGQPGAPWPGEFDDVRVWNRVVSAGELPALLAAATPAQATGAGR